MFRVAVCDDEATSLKLLSSVTEQILKDNGIPYEMRTFDDIEKMADSLSRPGRPYNMLITDIMSSGMNGIEAAEKLRSIGEKLDIVFVSSTAEYALEGYKVQALRYLKKPVDPEALKEVLLLSAGKVMQKDSISITCEGKFYNVLFKDIVYAESQAREIEFHLTDGRKLVAHMKISDLETMLTEKFFRCHRSYIVNLDEVENIERYQATMKNQAIVPISQQQYAEMKSRLYQR